MYSVSGTLGVCRSSRVVRHYITSSPLLTGPVRDPVAVMILVVVDSSSPDACEEYGERQLECTRAEQNAREHESDN